MDTVTYVNPYTTENYKWHLAAGKCPFIDSSKTFCNGDNGHLGAHWALLLEPGYHTTRRVALGVQHARP